MAPLVGPPTTGVRDAPLSFDVETVVDNSYFVEREETTTGGASGEKPAHSIFRA
jgi:hypothetical protein